VAYGDDEVGAGEYMELAELDAFIGLDVARRSQNREQDVVVAFELRSLVRVRMNIAV
jgi:hypothetical protein